MSGKHIPKANLEPGDIVVLPDRRVRLERVVLRTMRGRTSTWYEFVDLRYPDHIEAVPAPVWRRMCCGDARG